MIANPPPMVRQISKHVFTGRAFDAGVDLRAMYITLRLPDFTSQAFLTSKYAQRGRVAQASQWKLSDKQLDGTQLVSLRTLLDGVAVTFPAKASIHGDLDALDGSTAIHIADFKAGQYILFHISLTWDCLLHGVAHQSLWQGDHVRTSHRLERLGVALLPATVLATFNRAACTGTDRACLLEQVEHEHLAVLQAVRQYITDKDAAAYSNAATAREHPFALPPVEFAAAALAVQSKLTVPLKDYQVATVAWALWREQHGCLSQTLGALQTDTGQLVISGHEYRVRTRPAAAAPVRGGMILDEMGMGKTVEMLAVIMHDAAEPKAGGAAAAAASLPKRRRIAVPPAPTSVLAPSLPSPWLAVDTARQGYWDSDVAGVSAAYSFTISKAETPRLAGGTLVVVPVSLCSQWANEFRDKVRDAEARGVLLYHGPSRGQLVPALAAAANQVVVTTYETLTADERAMVAGRRTHLHSMQWACRNNMYLQPHKVASTPVQRFDVVLADDGVPYVVWAVGVADTAQAVRLHDLASSLTADGTWLLTPMQPHYLCTFGKQVAIKLASTVNVARLRWCSTVHVSVVTACPLCKAACPMEDMEVAARDACPSPLMAVDWHRVVLDESQKVQDASNQLSAMASSLRTHRRWCLTGTPMPKEFTNILGQLSFLGVAVPGTLATRHQAVLQHWIKDIMVRHTKSGSALNLPPVVYRTIAVTMTPQEQEAYRACRAATMVRFNQVADNLVAHTNELFGLLYAERQACSSFPPSYAGVARQLKRQRPAAPAAEVDCPVCLEMAAGMAAFACGHAQCYECLQTLLEAGQNTCPMCRAAIAPKDIVRAVQTCKTELAAAQLVLTGDGEVAAEADAGSSPPTAATAVTCGSKLDALQAYLAEDTTPFIIFTQFNPTVVALRGALARAGYSVRALMGDMTETARAQAVAAFHAVPANSGLIVSLRSASFGLNLTHGKRVVFYDTPLNEGMEAQGVGRVHRHGQTATVQVCHLVYAGSVEERIRRFRRVEDMQLDPAALRQELGSVTIIRSSTQRKVQREGQLRALVTMAADKD